MSAGYYAMFHCLAKECADLLIGPTKSKRSNEAWQQVYRALEHGVSKDKCKHTATINKFPPAIRDFADVYVTMQSKRHDADYDPFAQLTKSAVTADVQLIEKALASFKKAPLSDRRAFCAFVLFRERRN
jgi:hypothetical protein